MKRISRYARDYILEEFHVLYNFVDDRLMVLEDRLFDIFKDNVECLDRLEKLHPSLYQSLCYNGILVDDDTDELAVVIEKWSAVDHKPEEVKITVNPTLQCNLSCWYCYENHEGLTRMSDETISAVSNLIDAKLSMKSVKRLVLGFFGGEPMLYFASIVVPLAEYACRSCRESGKELTIGFTTNGTLLTDEVCRFLASLNVSVSLQITIDGDRPMHDATRFFVGGKPTYDLILGNIHRALDYGFYVAVRFNYTHRNFAGFRSVMDEFKELSDEERRHLTFDFHKVWQDECSEEVSNEIESTHERYLNDGFQSNNEIPGFSTSLCYADHEHNLVVNYDGNIFRCTARDFSPEKAEGHILADGTVEWYPAADVRRKIKFGSDQCRVCDIFPVCHASCSQDKIENISKNSCPRNFSEQDKRDIIRKKAEYRLKKEILSK